MKTSVFVYDPTANDPLSKVRGIGRYLQILKENFTEWNFRSNITVEQYNSSVFINPFFNFLQPPLTLRKIAKKQIAVIHDLIPLKYPQHFPVGIRGKVNIFLNKLVLKNYDLIVTDSNASKRDIISILHINENKIKVIYPCLPKTFILDFPKGTIARLRGSDNGLKTDNRLPTNYCLYVGDATWNKNLVNLAKAIKKINVTCLFVGNVFNSLTREHVNKSINNNEWLNEYKEFLNETKDDKRFIFLGFVPDEKLIQLYQQARCNVLVSRDEGFGFSYLEAASQSCPSVLSDTPVFQEVSNKQGILFTNPNNSNDIANTIGEVYFNQNLRNRLGKEAKERSKSFNQKKFISDFLKVLDF